MIRFLVKSVFNNNVNIPSWDLFSYAYKNIFVNYLLFNFNIWLFKSI